MYKVIKEYAGIKVGETITSNKKNIADYMVEKGYWEIIKPIKKRTPNVKQTKVDPITITNK